jgi:hypothetical protein
MASPDEAVTSFISGVQSFHIIKHLTAKHIGRFPLREKNDAKLAQAPFHVSAYNQPIWKKYVKR